MSNDDFIMKKYDINKSLDSSTHQATCYVEKIHSVTISPRYEFIIANGERGICLMDPENLDIFNIVYTKHPVMCS